MLYGALLPSAIKSFDSGFILSQATPVYKGMSKYSDKQREYHFNLTILPTFIRWW